MEPPDRSTSDPSIAQSLGGLTLSGQNYLGDLLITEHESSYDGCDILYFTHIENYTSLNNLQFNGLFLGLVYLQFINQAFIINETLINIVYCTWLVVLWIMHL